MGWAESNASRRQLLGQLSGQFTEMAKMKAAQKQAQKDRIAGFAQQGIGLFGQQMLEKQQQAGRLELAGAESGFKIAEDVSRIGEESDADIRYLTKQINEYYKELPGWQKDAKLKELLGGWEIAKSEGVSAELYWAGHAPEKRGEEEVDDLTKALKDPMTWASTTQDLYFYKAGLNPELFEGKGIPEEHKADLREYSNGYIDLVFPDISEADKFRLMKAIELQIGGPKAEEGPGGGGPGPPGGRAQQTEWLQGTLEYIPDLKEKQKTLRIGDPLRKVINKLLRDASIIGGKIGSQEDYDTWERQARAAIGLSPGKSLGTFEDDRIIPEHY